VWLFAAVLLLSAVLLPSVVLLTIMRRAHSQVAPPQPSNDIDLPLFDLSLGASVAEPTPGAPGLLAVPPVAVAMAAPAAEKEVVRRQVSISNDRGHPLSGGAGVAGVFGSLSAAASAAPSPSSEQALEERQEEEDAPEVEEEDDLFGTRMTLPSLLALTHPRPGVGASASAGLGAGLLARAESEMDMLAQLAAAPEQMARLFHEATIMPELMAKNRYSNIIPTRAARVLLPVTSSSSSSSSSSPSSPSSAASLAASYINACSFPPLLSGCRQRYISTQAPLASTVADFWSMVWHQRAEIVLMLTREHERDARGNVHHKAHAYWPQAKAAAAAASGAASSSSSSSDADLPSAQFGPWTLTLLSVRNEPDLIVREMLLTRTATASGGDASAAAADDADSEPRVVHQLQYIGWPDFGVPDDSDETAGFMHAFKLYRQIREQLRQQKLQAAGSAAAKAASAASSSAAPVIVHCSAGVGRSGVLIAIDALLDSLASQQRKRQQGAAAAGAVAGGAASQPNAPSSSAAEPLSVNMFSLTRRMRQHRQGMLQTKEQYAYVLHFVANCMRKKLFGVREPLERE
jgi:protein tyrosine phosphatase